jgi:hypothetical protein
MGPIGDISVCSAAAAQKPAWRTRALQKAKPASDLNGNRGDQAQARQGFQGRHDAVSLTCSGTEEPVPFRYEPRLASPFVAQLLGQLLPNPERPTSEARAAYGMADERSSRLLDTRL